MSLVFRYKKEQFGESKIKRPYIPIKLIGEKESQNVFMLLDSGADLTFIPKGLAEYLGLDLSGKPEDNKGVGGTIKTIHTKVNVGISKGHERYNFNIPVVVPLIDDVKSFLLLGRKDFFNKFDIIFKEYEEKVIMKRISPKIY